MKTRRSTITSALLCLSLGGAALSVAACDAGTGANVPPRLPDNAASAPKKTAEAAAPADPLGKRPELVAPKPFEPPVPEVFKAANGMNVWLFERHALPLVSAVMVIPSGAAVDPEGKAGLAYITADMLDEGAGKRSAVEVSSSINDLGASLSTGAGLDGSFVSVTVLKKNFKPAFEIFGDVVARPRFDAKEYKRVAELWKNDLKKRAQEPMAVARLVANAALYGPNTAYGHPTEGRLESASKIDLGAVKAFYGAHFRPDAATLMVAGDISRSELTEVIDASLGAWKAPKAGAAKAELARVESPKGSRRLVLVDRPDAPQSVIAVVRDGVAAGDPRAPLADLVNTALGGSFTSRLNQNLREEHGWTYGARSTFIESRHPGPFLAAASVVTDKTGPALKEMLAELDKMASGGLTEDEVAKVKAQDRADLVQAYEGVGSISRHLGRLATLGLAPNFDVTATRARQKATDADLKSLAALVDPKNAIVVVVGPKATVLPELEAMGLSKPELWDAEGVPLAPGGAAAVAAKDEAGKKPKK